MPLKPSDPNQYSKQTCQSDEQTAGSGTKVQDDNDVQLDLLNNEIVIREELGLDASLDECIQQYTHLEEELRLHFEIRHALQKRILLDTAWTAIARRSAGSGTGSDDSVQKQSEEPWTGLPQLSRNLQVFSSQNNSPARDDDDRRGAGRQSVELAQRNL